MISRTIKEQRTEYVLYQLVDYGLGFPVLLAAYLSGVFYFNQKIMRVVIGDRIEFQGSEPMFVIVRNEGFKMFTMGAMKQMTGPGAGGIRGLVIIAKSAFEKWIVERLQTFRPAPMPLRVCESEEEAVECIKQMIAEEGIQRNPAPTANQQAGEAEVRHIMEMLTGSTGIKARQAALLRVLRLFYLTIDASGIITSANPAACRLTGYPHDKLVGANASRIFDTQAMLAIMALFNPEALKNQELVIMTHVVDRRGNLHPLHLRLLAFPINPEGESEVMAVSFAPIRP